MAFDYEGAKREGYSDAEIAEHLSKKSGFKLDAARKEGYADADIIKHLVSKESKSNLPSMFPSFEQPPAEIPQSKLHMAGDFLGGLLETPANLAGQGIGVIAGGVKAAGNSLAALAAGVPVGEAAGEGFHSGMNQARTITGTMPETFTGQRFDETMGDLFKKSISGIGASYEKLKRAFDLGLLEDLKKIDPNKYKEVYDRVHTKSGQARSLIEGLTESSAIALGAKSSGTAISKGMTNYKLRRDLKRDTGIREAPPAPETPRVWEQVEQAHAPLEGTVRAPQYGMGEVPSYIERDMFGQPEIRPPVVERPQFGPENLSDTAAIDAQTPRSPFTRQDTPPQLDKMNRAGQELPVDPNRPFYGDPRVGMTRELPDTRYDLSRTPVNEQPGRPEGGTRYQRPENDVRRVTEDGLPPGTVEWDRPTLANKFSEPEIPGVPFEGNRPFFGREDFAATTGWQVADARVAEAIAGDSYLKGMQTRLAKMEENLKGIGEMQGEVAQRYGQRRIGEGGSGQQIGRELVSYTKSMKAVEKDIAALKEKIDSRVKMHEERVRNQPKIEKTIDPFKKGPGRRSPKGRPGGRQGGAVNPEVFIEGFQKAKDLVERGLRLIARGAKDSLAIYAYDPQTREIAGRATFVPSRGGLVELKDRNLHSAGTEVDPFFQRQGLATEMYKFARELGNDIEPSKFQTEQGKAMWDGFKAKGVPLSQRGAVDPTVFSDFAKKSTEQLKALATSLRERYFKTGKNFKPALDETLREDVRSTLDKVEMEIARREYKDKTTNPNNPVVDIFPGFRKLPDGVRISYQDRKTGKVEIGKVIESKLVNAGGEKTFIPKVLREDGSRTNVFASEIVEVHAPRPLPPIGQRGAVDFGVSKKVGDLIDKLRNKNDSKAPERTLAQVRTDREGLLRSADGENRPPEQALKEIDPKTLKDLPDSPFEQTLEALSNAQMVYNNTRNPWVKYVSDFATNAKQQAVLLHESLTQGISFGKGLLPNKIIDRNSPAGIWNSISGFDRRVLTDIINKYNGIEWPSRDTVIAMGGKEKHVKMLERLQEPLNNLWSRINDELQAQGKAPMPFRPFYFMKAQGFGPWLVRIKDVEGTTIAFHRMETKFGANKMAKELSSRFKDETYQIQVDVADRATKGNKYNISTTMLEQIYQALEKGDPRREAITSAIADIKSKGGFEAHRARRGEVKGMELSPQNFMKTYDAYIKDGSNYIANLQIGKALKDISTMQEIPPRLRSWSMDYLNIARGGADPGAVVRGIEAFADGLVQVATLGQTGPGIARKLTTELGRGFMTSILFFGNVPFLVGQALQSTAFAPTMLSNYKFNMGYSKGSVTGSFVEGTLRMLTGDKEFREMTAFLAARGKLDPTLVSEVSVFSRVGAGLTSNAPLMDKGLAALRKTGDIASGTFIGRHLESMGRMHAAAIGLDFLKKNGLEGKELKLAVERFVDDTMANYSMTDRPGLIARTGIVGEGMKPLSTFKNWFLGMTAIMMKDAAQGISKGQFSRAIPIANLWLSTAIFGGLTGSIAFKELDMLFDFFKKQEWFQDTLKKAGFNVNAATPSLTEWILRSPIPDAGKLGVVTGATQLIDPRGIHIAGSMTSPEVMPSMMEWGFKGLMPGVGFGAELVDALSTLGMDRVGMKTATVEEKRKAWKQMLPGIGDRILNNLDSELPTDSMNPLDGKIGFGDKPIPGGTRGYGTVRRDGFETMASIIGAGTIPEVKVKSAKRDIDEQRLSLADRKKRLVDLGIDAIQSGNTDQLSTHMQKAIELGFHDYTEALQGAMMRRMTTEKERTRISGPQQLRQWEYVEEAGRVQP